MNRQSCGTSATDCVVVVVIIRRSLSVTDSNCTVAQLSFFSVILVQSTTVPEHDARLKTYADAVRYVQQRYY